nr:hypothetical protein [uncultured bacterium]
MTIVIIKGHVGFFEFFKSIGRFSPEKRKLMGNSIQLQKSYPNEKRHFPKIIS